VLGSTGSVGTQALDVVRSMPDRFRVVGLAAGSRWQALARQVEEFRPEVVALAQDEAAGRLARSLDGSGVGVLSGPEGLRRLASWEGADLVLSAVSGTAGLPAALAALETGKTLALANKEAVVSGGPLLCETAARTGALLLPVDSEHSAIFQLLAGVDRSEVERVILTASGGPFRGMSAGQMAHVTPQQALRHPTWRMGRKITVDSANLMNKALEVVEARWLFDLAPDRISVLIHPQSVVHGMLEMADGSVLAHMGAADMRLPILYAFAYPDRLSGPARRLDLGGIAKLEFEEPDLDAFPALALGYRVARAEGTSGAVLCAANERAVEAFLRGRIAFTDIARLVRAVLDRHQVILRPGLEAITEADRWARQEAERCLALL